jgi:hypothetical protein
MSADRELLDLAFKASGLKSTFFWMGEQKVAHLESAGILVEDDLPRIEDSPHSYGRWWNPLTDDGDALRLAVKLKIDFYEGEDDGPAAYAGYYVGTRQRFMTEPHGTEPIAATRRAIVRAAAEIGRSLP